MARCTARSPSRTRRLVHETLPGSVINRRLSQPRLQTILSSATGSAVSTHPHWGGVFSDLDGAKERGISVKSYLRPDATTGRIALAVWPADTLTGAKVFYANPKLVAAFRDQGRFDGWQLKPSFRFGYRDGTQLVVMTGDIDVDSYIALCTKAVLDGSGRLMRPKRLPPSDWDPYLRNLVELGIATDANCAEFQVHFRRFPAADARPGLELARTWAIDDAERLDDAGAFIGEVREAFQVLAALCTS